MAQSVMPMIGNLAWVPMPSVSEVEIFDRFNGVPTFGVVRAAPGAHLFWRTTGYVSEHVSCWLYMPLTVDDEARLKGCASDDVFDSALGADDGEGRFVTLGVAWDNRLIFEREWHLPSGAPLEVAAGEGVAYIAEALRIASEQELPPSRLDIMRRAVQEMALR